MTLTLNLSGWSDRQKQAIESRGQNVLVSAGAGSGKTSVLVERVVHCLTGDDAVDVTRLLVVTFTEAAAGEMRKRIVDRLQVLAEQARKAGELSDVQWLTRQIQGMEQAQISTLHSFCMQVVRRNFLHLEIEPRFDLLTEDDALFMRSSLLEDLIERRLQNTANLSFRDMINQFAGGNPSSLAPIVDRLDEFARSQPKPGAWLELMRARFFDAAQLPFTDLAWTDAFLQWVSRRLDEAQMAFLEGVRLASGQDELASYEDNLAEMCRLTGEARKLLREVNDPEQLAAMLAAALSLKSPRAKDHPDKERVRDCRTHGLDLLKEVHQVLGRGAEALRQDIVDLAPQVGELVDLVLDFQAAYDGRKRVEGVLDFQDLEHLAYKAIHDASSGEARRLQEQYTEIFVDEYQDTSPIQDAIVEAVSRPEGNVFVVGDVKQSIYRFRMAEPQLFLNKYHTLGISKPGQVIDLVANYRSRPGIVDAVNFFFMQLFSKDFGGISYDASTQMQAGARYGAGDSLPTLAGPVEVHLVERSSKEQTDDQTRDGDPIVQLNDSPQVEEDNVGGSVDDTSSMEKEAWVIAERIQQLMGQVDGHPHHQVWDPKAEQYRPLQYRDIVVLLRSVKSRMNTVLDVFRQAQIPAYGATSTGFYGALEVQWILSALAAIDNPRREIDLAVLMRSPMGGFLDDDLARIRCTQHGNLYDAVKYVGTCKTIPDAWLQMSGDAASSWAEGLIGKVQTFLRQLQSWRTLARRASTEDVMRKILDDSALLNYVGGMKGGRVRQGNIQVLLEKARSFDRASFDSVYGFVTRARKALTHDVDVGEARTLGENEDVVRVMTIHQSKGLEYPVVFVADIGKLFYRGNTERALPLHRDLGFGPQCTDVDTDQRWQTIASLAIDEKETREFLAEEARVLYVAMTRARERLILVGSSRKLAKQAAKAADAYVPGEASLPIPSMMQAKSYLDWLMTTLFRHRDGQPIRELARDEGWVGDFHAEEFLHHPAQFEVTLWNHEQGQDLPVIHGQQTAASLSQDVIQSTDLQVWMDAVKHALPHEPIDTRDNTIPSVEGTGSPQVIFSEESTVKVVPGKVSATELRRLWSAKKSRARHQGSVMHSSPEHLLEDPKFVRGDETTGRESGIAFHAVMQHLDFRIEPTQRGVSSELNNLARMGMVHPSMVDAVDVEEVVAFLQSELGARLAKARRVLREQPFFYRIPIAKSDHVKTPESKDMVIAQGVIDCLAEEEDGWLVIDYKTDRVTGRDVDQKAEEYAAQLSTYVAVAKSLLPNQTINSYIYFVKPRLVVPMQPVAVEDVF